MTYKDSKARKEIVRKFIRNNPKTTYQEIKKTFGIKIERLYGGGMKEAFKDATVAPPRNFKRKTKEDNRKIIIDYIRKNPNASVHSIIKDVKINPSSIFKNIKEAFKEAQVVYPREKLLRSNEEKRKEILDLVRNNPNITILEIIKKSKTKPYRLFKNLDNIFEEAKIEKRNGWKNGQEKRRIKKRVLVIDYIRKNPIATQREINITCKTRVQNLFDKGIYGAYEKAGIKFPYERLKLYGTALKKIKKRAKNFEDEIAIKLSRYGNVKRLVKTKRGIADIVFERKGYKAIIEIKDYRNKDISRSQINQLNRYLLDCKCNIGFLICHNKPRKDKFLIDKNKIIILNKFELCRLPELMGT